LVNNKLTFTKENDILIYITLILNLLEDSWERILDDVNEHTTPEHGGVTLILYQLFKLGLSELFPLSSVHFSTFNIAEITSKLFCSRSVIIFFYFFSICHNLEYVIINFFFNLLKDWPYAITLKVTIKQRFLSHNQHIGAAID
jgi:hypothetical protein